MAKELDIPDIVDENYSDDNLPLQTLDSFNDNSPDALAENFSDKYGDLLKELSDFDPYLTKMVAEWLGYVWNVAQSKYVIGKGLTPLMNVQGARWCINLMRTYVRNDNIITSLDLDTYQNLICGLIDILYTNLPTRRKEFGIQNTGDVLKICEQIQASAQLVLIGAAGNDNYRKFLQPTLGRKEDVNKGETQNKQSGFFAPIKQLFGGN